jgi:predicted lipoprotein with Yx(FWY)xxD motif
MNNKTIGIVVLVAAVVVAAAVIFNGKMPGKNNTTNTPKQTTDQVAASPCDGQTGKVVKVAEGKLGKYLVDSQCKTLYVTSADKSGESTCYDKCAETWIPFAYDQTDLSKETDALSKQLNVIKRKDGSYQYSFGTTPLYYFKGDAKVGDTAGNGVNKVWSVVLVDQQATKK